MSQFPSMLVEVSIQMDVHIIVDDKHPPIRKIVGSKDGLYLDQRFDQAVLNQQFVLLEFL